MLKHNESGVHTLDVIRVGDESAPALGTKDPEILVWAEQHNCILVSNDRATLAGHLSDHFATGRHMPGIFTLRRGATLESVIDFLVAAAYASETREWSNRIEFIP